MIFSGHFQHLALWVPMLGAKHISFDLWNTLIDSNPTFKSERGAWLAETWGLPAPLITQTFAQVGADYNESVENGGPNVSPKDLVAKVFQELHQGKLPDNLLLEGWVAKMYELFLANPPRLMDEHVYFCLKSLKEKGFSLSITSNTAFISGTVLAQMLERVGIAEYFDFQLYSDIEECSKPSPHLFLKMKKMADALHEKPLSNSEVLHIGDNKHADFIGAKALRFKALWIDMHASRNYAYLQGPRLAVHQVTRDDVQSFSPAEYSKFKFGRQDTAAQYAKELFLAFQDDYRSLVQGRNVVVFPSPYSSIPTASYYIAKAFCDQLRSGAQKLAVNNITLGKIVRGVTYKQDYGELGLEDRFNLIKNDSYIFETFFEQEDLLVFIDDISVTGSHQMVLENLLRETNTSNHALFLYAIAVTNPKVCPTIENAFNYASVSKKSDLVEIFNHSDFSINTRTVKFFLKEPLEDFTQLLPLINPDVLRLVLSEAQGNAYHEMEQYQSGYEVLNGFWETYCVY